MFNWEDATPFQCQEELTEPERFYMNELVKKGHEVRYDEKRIYNRTSNGNPVSILRANLLYKNSYDKS